MPIPEKSLTRKAVESLALKLIIFIAGLVGAAMLGWLAVNSAWIHGVPGYKVALIVAALFALCGIGLYFVILAIARIPLRNAPAGSLLEPQESWLAAIVERDRLELYHAVFVTDCRVREQLTGTNPHIVFDFHICNGTVFSITIDPDIKGFISFFDVRLSGNIGASSLPHNLQHGLSGDFEIRQELGGDDVAEIKKADAIHGQGFYDFGKLYITIKGTSPTTDALPARLQFRRVTRRLISNGFELV